MNRTIVSFLLFLLFVSFSQAQVLEHMTVTANTEAPGFAGYQQREIVVKFNRDMVERIVRQADFSKGLTGIANLDALNKRFGVNALLQKYPNLTPRVYQGRTIDPRGWFRVSFKADVDVEQVVRAYKGLRGVIDAQPIGIHRITATANDPNYVDQWHMNQANDADVDAPEAWDIETGNTQIIVADMDTGVRYFHKDLGGANASYDTPENSRGNMWINEAELNGTDGVDDDGNGFVDDWIGWDFVDNQTGWTGEDVDTPDNDPRDFNGHGTHVAGLLSAINNNGYAVTSVAGGRLNGSQAVNGNGVKIMALRIGWSGRFFIFEVGYIDMGHAADAFYYAANNGARIASCSWGSSNTGGLGDAIDYFVAGGGLVFKAAGNDDNEDSDYMLDRADVIGVASTDQNDVKSDFSTYGTFVDISAPGTDIVSTYHDKDDPQNDKVATLSGTSMATPLTASVAALIWSKHPDWTADQVKQRLFDTADDIYGIAGNSAYQGKLGAGRVNAFNAVNDGGTGGPTPPTANFTGSPTSGCPTLTVNFTDQSSGDITDWSWDFGDGTTSTLQNPSHDYANPGSYTVSLTVTGPGGSDTNTKNNYITVEDPAVTADFSGTPTSGDAPLDVAFTDNSTGASSWSWDFGDGATSTAQNPTHTYTVAGVYTVTLTASNSCGTDTQTKVDYITVTEPQGGNDETHVASNTVVKESFFIVTRGNATVKIVDQNGNPVADATVDGSWSGSVNQSVSITTDANGEANSISSWVFGDGTFQFCVDNVTKTGYTYNASANVVTCASTDGSSSAAKNVVAKEVKIEDVEKDLGFKLAGNSPNPFNPVTTITYVLPENARVRLDIFNVLGQRVKTLVDGQVEAGINTVVWNGKDAVGNQVSSGFYVYQITINNKDVLRKKMLMLK
ncbi:MAG TPA: PKD domain-containing protein [Caldithrix abyssi]|uniref:PKD domain-containing protein n=1 Tax=Caldithrix abyssi TaxID=187145 RepID=A0A7V1LZ20_CALAY|nr:PKD domain-containing protein [Caldithrix abyssi]